MKKDLAYYRALPYRRMEERLSEDGRTYWVVRYETLPGLIAAHDDRLSAHELSKELFDEYIETHLEQALPIPEPARASFRAPGGQGKIRWVIDAASAGSAKAKRIPATEGQPASSAVRVATSRLDPVT